jgi:hypothetical protein
VPGDEAQLDGPRLARPGGAGRRIRRGANVRIGSSVLITITGQRRGTWVVGCGWVAGVGASRDTGWLLFTP